MTTSHIAFLLVLFLCPCGLAGASEVRVPADYPTIQSAISGTPAGWTIIVEPGTYVENIKFEGKAVTVVSLRGPEETVIHAAKSGSVVSFVDKEGAESVFDGFTITGCQKPSPAVSCVDSSPLIRNNVIIRNKGGDHLNHLVAPDHQQPDREEWHSLGRRGRGLDGLRREQSDRSEHDLLGERHHGQGEGDLSRSRFSAVDLDDRVR